MLWLFNNYTLVSGRHVHLALFEDRGTRRTFLHIGNGTAFGSWSFGSVRGPSSIDNCAVGVSPEAFAGCKNTETFAACFVVLFLVACHMSICTFLVSYTTPRFALLDHAVSNCVCLRENVPRRSLRRKCAEHR